MRRRCVAYPHRQTYRDQQPWLTPLQHSSGNQKAEEDAKKDTDVKVKEIEELGNKSGGQVVDQLIEAVMNANPSPPK